MNNGWKALLGAGALAAVDVGIAEYFFQRTMVRQNAKVERTKEMSGTDWARYMPKIAKWKEWMLEQPHEDVYIRSGDGLKLHGTYFTRPEPDSGGRQDGQENGAEEAGEGKKTPAKVVICFHGYTSEGVSGFIGLSNYYLPRGYEMLLVDQRAHGASEGRYIGFGCLDRRDALCWIRYVEERRGRDAQILLHGTSMGGATVLMASGLNLPSSVKGIISDCAFTSAWDVFTHVLRNEYHLPARPIMEAADRLVKARAGYGLRECSAAQEVKKARVPILFIHGDADTFVPCWMCETIYDNCASRKEKLIVHGAGHCESHYMATEEVEEKLTEFLDSVL